MALVATTALFAAAFLAMRTVRMFPVFSSPAEEVPPPAIIHFEPPKPEPRPEPRPSATTTRVVTPSVVAPPTVVPTVIAPPVTTPVVPPGSASGADTTRGVPSRRITDLLPVQPALRPPEVVVNPRGAPISRAGVTAPFRPLTAAEKDSIDAVRASRLAEALRRPPTKDELEAIKHNGEPGRAPSNTRAGSDGKTVPLMNGGVSTAIPLGSITTGWLSGGPSPAERKRNATIDSANQLILKRLQDRAILLRDSLRADSLRRDSLAKKIRP